VAVALLITTVRSFPPSIWGKLSTVVQVMGALIVICGHAYFPDESHLLDGLAVPATALATLISGLHYLWTAGRQLRVLRK
jgi:phosphatidylglycerophosphate synthase